MVEKPRQLSSVFGLVESETKGLLFHLQKEELLELVWKEMQDCLNPKAGQTDLEQRVVSSQQMAVDRLVV